MSGMYGINAALSAIYAQQYAMDVTAHNIANANTPGYRRQEAALIANRPLSGLFGATAVGSAQLGTGVMVHSVRRAQTVFLDAQIRAAYHWMGDWDARNTALAQLEPMLAEPGENGLSAELSRFWNSWQDLATTPESLPARVAIVESGAALADRIRSLYRNMYDLQTDADRTIAAQADEINLIAHEIAGLNAQIREAAPGVYEPNDLLDQRDQLLERLSQIVRIEVNGVSGVDTIVSVGGKALVQGTHVSELEAEVGAGGWSKLVWSDNGSEIVPGTGKLNGLMQVRDVVLADYMGQLDTIAQAIVTRVNELHTTGLDMAGADAGDFFTAGSTAADISVDAALLAAPAGVAAGAAGMGAGDNSIAAAIADIREELIVGGQTVGAAYTALVSRIGSQAGEATIRTEVQEISLDQLRTQRESVVGVSLDEEMVNMTKFEQAYNAAARILTVMDEMLDLIINRMGVSGR